MPGREARLWVLRRLSLVRTRTDVPTHHLWPRLHSHHPPGQLLPAGRKLLWRETLSEVEGVATDFATQTISYGPNAEGAAPQRMCETGSCHWSLSASPGSAGRYAPIRKLTMAAQSFMAGATQTTGGPRNVMPSFLRADSCTMPISTGPVSAGSLSDSGELASQ